MRLGFMFFVAFVFVACVEESSPGEDDTNEAQQPSTLSGSYVVRNEVDLDLLNTYKRLTGDLRIEANGMYAIDLDLQHIGGRLTCLHNTTLIQLRAHRLRSVGKVVIDFNEQLEDVEFPVLERVSTNMELEGNGVTSLRLDRLTEVGDTVFIQENGSLELLSMPSLTTVGGAFLVEDNPLLPSCQVDALVTRLVRLGFEGSVATQGNNLERGCSM